MLHTFLELLDMAKDQAGIPSDYALAKRLGVTKQAVSNMRNGRRIMEDEMALELAHMARLPEAYVLACLEVERAKCTATRNAWASAADMLGKHAKALIRQEKAA